MKRGPPPARISAANFTAAASTASTSLPSIFTDGMSSARARADTPSPAVIGPVGVVAEMRLSSHTNSTGSLNTCAQLRPSRNGPRLAAPSPKKHATIWGSFFTFNACAAPVAIGMPAATTPLAPSMPTEKSAMCIEPPLPLL